MIENVTPAKIEEWANKYPEVPLINTTGHYAFTGGSDDHGSLAIAKSYTTFMGQPNAASLKEALRARKTQPAGEFGSASVLAHNCYGVLGGFLESTGQLSMEPPEEGEESNTSISLLELLNSIKTNMEKQGGLMDLSSLTSIGHSDEYQDKMKIALSRPSLWNGARPSINWAPSLAVGDLPTLLTLLVSSFVRRLWSCRISSRIAISRATIKGPRITEPESPVNRPQPVLASLSFPIRSMT